MGVKVEKGPDPPDSSVLESQKRVDWVVDSPQPSEPNRVGSRRRRRCDREMTSGEVSEDFRDIHWCRRCPFESSVAGFELLNGHLTLQTVTSDLLRSEFGYKDNR